MPFWVELHCDAVTKDGRIARNEVGACWSFRHDNPSVMTTSPSTARGLLATEAKERGWRKQKGGWVCPSCRRANRAPAKPA